MFSLNKCMVRACSNLAVSTLDENGNLNEGKSYCLIHAPNPGKIQQDIINYIASHDVIVGLNASSMAFSDIDFSNKRFYGCNFMHCTFKNVHSKGFRSRMSMFDFSVFADCNLIESNIQFTSFSGGTFSHTLFTGSDLVQNNFNGISAFQSSFDDTDLYNSRFIKSKLINTSFRNCNLKKVLFYKHELENVSFKMSNTKEAVFEKAGSQIYMDLDETLRENQVEGEILQ